MLKLTTQYGFHELFLTFMVTSTTYCTTFYSNG